MEPADNADPAMAARARSAQAARDLVSADVRALCEPDRKPDSFLAGGGDYPRRAALFCERIDRERDRHSADVGMALRR